MSVQADFSAAAAVRDRRPVWLLLALACFAVLAVLALRFGYRPVGWADVWGAFTAFENSSEAQIVIREIRLPRLAGAILAGAALGISGALIQGMTRNPLADPGLLGINAGAAMGVVGVVFILGMTDPAQFVWVALGGGSAGALLVFSLGGGAQSSPVRLLLAGAAVTALFLALTRGLLLVSRQSLEVYRFWVLGGFDGITLSSLSSLLPFFAAGLVLALAAAAMLNALILGEDTARSLGVNVGIAKLTAGAGIVVLCAATVSMAGPIAFVGLIVPHLARAAARQDMKWLTLYSAVFGAGLMVAADLAGRLPLFGGNMQAGVMAALIGGPVLTWLVRKGGVSKL